MQPPTKTLIIRFSSIGDIVLTTPLLRVLRARFPDIQMDYVVRKTYADLVRSNHNLNVTYEFDASTGFAGLRMLKKRLKGERYDLVLDLHDSIRSRYLRSLLGVDRIAVLDKRLKERTMLVRFKKNIYRGLVPVVDRYIETLEDYGITNDGRGPELHIPDETLFGVSGRMAGFRLNRFEHVLGVCPFARHWTKEWPLEFFTEIAKRFVREKDGAVMIFGGRADVERAQHLTAQLGEASVPERIVNLAGMLSLTETAAAMQYCDVLLTNDTGLMHIADAMQKKVVALFGSTVREFGFYPRPENAVVMERPGLYCRPCSHVGRDKCPEEHFRCMREIEPTDVFEAVRELLGRTEDSA
jgi:lipopolysaccharide heptosyltransferase II